MAVQFALPVAWGSLGLRRPGLPPAIPPFSNRIYGLFWAIWLAALALAVAGPVAGLYYRYSKPDTNSLLMLGSRAGIAVSEEDATRIRFPVGPSARMSGIKGGDDLVQIDGIPLPDVMPMTDAALARHEQDPAYVALADLFYGTDSYDTTLRLRSPDGRERNVVVRTGEQHIDAGARELGIPPGVLSFVDLLHIITYPFLLWAAWILHRRNARDAVSSILSLAILLTIGTEQPSATFLATIGVPRWMHVALYDLGNLCLLGGILLFPHGKLSPRLVLLLACLPVLIFLHGDAYRAIFMAFMICAVLMLLRYLRLTPPGDLRLQIKWALFGFCGYAVFLGISLLGDMLKTATGAFAHQLAVEMGAGLAMGLAFVLLQLGLLIALLRYRLYDAEAVISRTASIAIVTLVLGAGFAAVMEGIIEGAQNLYGGSNGTGAAMVGAVVATVLLHPLHERTQKWAERRFHKNLLRLREGLPELMRDLREIASVPEFLEEVLGAINRSLYATRSAFVVGRSVEHAVGISQAEALRWLLGSKPDQTEEALQCDRRDAVFPLRVRVGGTSNTPEGWLLIGPRPDGSLPGQDEREALAQIADPLARAFRIVVKRQNDEAELMRLLEAYRLRIEDLERRLLL